MSLQTVGKATKYGLVNSVNNPPLKRPALAAFANDDDEEEEEERGCDHHESKRAHIARANQLLMARQTEVPSAAELPPECYDYEEAYESFKASTSSSAPVVAGERRSEGAVIAKSQYIGNMMATAKVREQEKERIFERKLMRERQKEDENFPDQERFVTAAYRQKLIEQQKWDQEDRRQEAMEQHHDARTQGMAGFYSNLLTRNVAVGGDVKTAARSAYTAGSERQQKIVDMHIDPSSSISSSSDVARRAKDSSAAVPSTSAITNTSDPRSTATAAATATAAFEEKAALGREAPHLLDLDGTGSEEGREASRVATKSSVAVSLDPVAAAKARYLARKTTAEVLK